MINILRFHIMFLTHRRAMRTRRLLGSLYNVQYKYYVSIAERVQEDSV